MKRICAINVQSDYIAALVVEKKHNFFNLIDSQNIELSDLSEFLKDKKSYYLSVEQDEVIDEKISIESVVKNDNVIRNLILRKLYSGVDNKQIIFNYYPLPNTQNDDKTAYQIDGVYEESYLSSLKLISNQNEIKRATTNKFSLLGISCECIKAKSYFSIHTQANKITIIAIHNNSMIFSRVNKIIADNAQDRKTNIVDEVTQTIAYVQQQFRDIDFSLVALSGSLAIDDVIIEHIHMSSGLSVTVLYPNTFIRGFQNEESQQYIFAIGSLFIQKRYQFLPNLILGIKQYNLISKILLVSSIIFIFLSSFFAYEKFDSYYNSLQKYEIVKHRLDKVAINTNMYSSEELNKSLKYLELSEKYMQFHPLDIILSLKQLIKLQKPEEVTWSYDNENLKFSATFKRSFKTLGELNKFEKLFLTEFEDINSTFSKNYSTKSDYKKMDFHMNIIVENSKKEEKQQEQRRRR